MRLLALSVNYRAAPLALRERVCFPPERAGEVLTYLGRTMSQQLAESAILSTCNRTEVYGAVKDTGAAAEALIEWLADGSALLRSELRSHARVLSRDEAARHAFRVASGLDSMVIGEPQILGQMKSAVRSAHAAGTLGPLLHQLFQRAFAVAKEVRTQTSIGRGVLSHAAASVELARSLFGDLAETRVLFIGAGAMIESVAAHYAAQRLREIAVANRTRERGERIARRFSGNSMGLADVAGCLSRFDIVVSCTSSTLPLVTGAMVHHAQVARDWKPLLVIDLGVPRNVDPEIARLPGVTLYTVDDLGRLLQSRGAVRGDAVKHAERIIDAHLKSFMDWVAVRPCVPLLRRLNDQVERVRAAELKRARRNLAQGHSVEQVLDRLASGLSNKLLHPPRTLLRGSTTPEQAQQFLDHWVGALERGVRV